MSKNIKKKGRKKYNLLNHTGRKSEQLAIVSTATFNLETIRNNLAPCTKAPKAYLNAFQSSFGELAGHGVGTANIMQGKPLASNRRVNNRERPRSTANNRARSRTTTNCSKSIPNDREQLRTVG